MATVLVVGVAGAYALTRTGSGSAGNGPSPRPGTSSSPGATAPVADLAVLSITGGSGPMILVVGDASGPVAITMPQKMMQVVPGMGEVDLDALGQLDGATVRIGVSNTLGLWVRHFGVASVQSIAKAVDAAGGIPVDLGRAFKVNGATVGPGTVNLTGAQVTAFLTGPQAAASARWGAFSRALLSQRLPLPPNALVETDNAAAVSRLLAAAKGARLTVLPVTDVGGLVQVPDLIAIDAFTAASLGSGGPATPVIVQNGNGVPGVGADVAERLIPAGFRVVLSTNAETFTVRRTSIIALGTDVAGEAKRARHALGLGVMTVSSVPSGVGDVKIIVGKDFK